METELDLEDVIFIADTTTLEFKDEEAVAKYKELIHINKKDPVSLSVLTFIARWAKVMQYLVEKKGCSVAESAETTYSICDLEGMSGFTFGLAVGTLCDVWKYGEELRLWHNKQYDYEGDGVVNPAIIHIKSVNSKKSDDNIEL